MIFVCVGTTHMRFDRLVRAVEGLPLDEVVIQHGPSRPPEGVRRAVPFMPFPEMVEHFENARAVVTHAGVGNVLCAFNAGQVPVVVPRLRRFGETVDDHQTELAAALGDTGKAIAVWDTDELAAAVESVPGRHAAAIHREGELHRAVREALIGGEATPARGRSGLLRAIAGRQSAQ